MTSHVRLMQPALLLLWVPMVLPASANDGDRNDRRAENVQPMFGLDKPSDGPFPSDRFTIADESQNTCERVNLPMPADCVANKSTCIELGLVNELDGFNNRPRISIPFNGDIDLKTVDSSSIFIVKLGDAMIDGRPDCLAAPMVHEEDDEVVPRRDAGWVVGIDQAVWDPTTHTLHAKAAELLEQHTRYVVFVTRNIKNAAGEPIETAKAFKQAIGDDDEAEDDVRADRAIATYEVSLRRAVAQARFFGVKRHDIAVATVFTTLSVTAPIEKIREAAIAADVPATSTFTIANGGARALFDVGKLTTITFNRQFSVDGPLSPNSLSSVGTTLRSIPGAVQSLAFFRVRVPNFVQNDATFVPFGSYSGSPTQFGTTDLYVELVLPSGTTPPGGWPVVFWGFGSSENGFNGSQIRVAADFASHGIATLSFNPIGYGFGPKTSLTIAQTGKPTLTVPYAGRQFDLDHDGLFGPNEGGFGLDETRIVFDRDKNRQLIADVAQLIRAIEAGVDVDGDGVRDLDPDRLYWGGLSMGAVEGILIGTVESRFKAVALSSPNCFIDYSKVTAQRGATLGLMLQQHVPGLINPPGTPVITQIGGVAVTPPFWNENIPDPGQAPVVNNIAGAMAVPRHD